MINFRSLLTFTYAASALLLMTSTPSWAGGGAGNIDVAGTCEGGANAGIVCFSDECGSDGKCLKLTHKHEIPIRACKGGPDNGKLCSVPGDCQNKHCELQYLSSPIKGTLTVIVDDSSDLPVDDLLCESRVGVIATIVLAVEKGNAPYIFSQTYSPNAYISPNDSNAYDGELCKHNNSRGGSLGTLRPYLFPSYLRDEEGLDETDLEDILFETDEAIAQGLRNLFGETGRPIIDKVESVQRFPQEGTSNSLASVARLQIRLRFVRTTTVQFGD